MSDETPIFVNETIKTLEPEDLSGYFSDVRDFLDTIEREYPQYHDFYLSVNHYYEDVEVKISGMRSETDAELAARKKRQEAARRAAATRKQREDEKKSRQREEAISTVKKLLEQNPGLLDELK